MFRQLGPSVELMIVIWAAAETEAEGKLLSLTYAEGPNVRESVVGGLSGLSGWGQVAVQ